MEMKHKFVTNAFFYGIILALVLAVYKYVLPILAPFIIGFTVAWLVQLPLRRLAKKYPKWRKPLSAALCVVVYVAVGGLVVLRRVAAGPFDNRAAADALRRQVREDHALDALISGGANGGWRVQLGVFASEKNALALRDKLAATGTRVNVEARVQVGPYASRNEAETVGAALENMGLRAVQVTEQ